MQDVLALACVAVAACYLGWTLWNSLTGGCTGCGGGKKPPAEAPLIPVSDLTARVRGATSPPRPLSLPWERGSPPSTCRLAPPLPRAGEGGGG